MVIKFSAKLLLSCLITWSFSSGCNLNSYRIEEIYFNEFILAYFISSFDGSRSVSQSNLFEFQIYSDDPSCIDTTLYMNFNFKVHSPGLGFTTFESFYNGTIRIDKIDNEIIFGNNHISYAALPIQSTQFNLINYSGPDSYNNPQAETLISYISQAGRIPNGKYLFQFGLFADNDMESYPIDQISKTIDVDAPVVFDLLSPGGDYTTIDDNYVYTTYPLFNWYADYCPNCDVGIRICEFDPNKHNSLPEALQDISHLPFKQNSEYHPVSSILNSFQYPAAGSKSLEAGKLYVWQLRRSYRSTIVTNFDYSPIFIFEIRKAEGSKEELTENYFDVLKTIIGTEKSDLWFTSGGELERFNIEGDTILIDGEEVPVEALHSILSDIESEIITVREVKLK